MNSTFSCKRAAATCELHALRKIPIHDEFLIRRSTLSFVRARVCFFSVCVVPDVQSTAKQVDTK